MAAEKEQFRKAMTVLREMAQILSSDRRILACQSLEVIERFVGGLRRERAALNRQNESVSKEIAALKAQLEKERTDMARLDLRSREQRAEFELMLKKAYGPGIRLRHAGIPGAEFTLIKVKCLACSLHFLVCKDTPESHSGASLYCPECGHHDGGFLLWRDEVHGFIFELVPGRSEPIGYPNLAVLGAIPTTDQEG